MKSVTTRYDKVTHTVKRSGVCPRCQGRVTRQTTFYQTVNPFNRAADGSIKSRLDIRKELKAEGNAWKPDFTHEVCPT